MNGSMIADTPYDVRWTMFGIPCRIHPFFWLMAAFVCWHQLDYGIAHLLVGMFCVLASILLHELGHVWAGLLFGSRGYIILWGMGGLAVGSNQLESRWQRIFVSAAGPLIQLLLFGVLFGLVFVQPELMTFPKRITEPMPLLTTFFSIMLFINLVWPLLNLLPIYPLDGGQIARDLLTAVSRDGVRQSLFLSIGICALLGLYCFFVAGTDRAIPWLPLGRNSGIFFLVFAALNIQLLMIENDRRNWTDDHRWQ